MVYLGWGTYPISCTWNCTGCLCKNILSFRCVCIIVFETVLHLILDSNVFQSLPSLAQDFLSLLHKVTWLSCQPELPWPSIEFFAIGPSSRISCIVTCNLNFLVFPLSHFCKHLKTILVFQICAAPLLICFSSSGAKYIFVIIIAILDEEFVHKNFPTTCSIVSISRIFMNLVVFPLLLSKIFYWFRNFYELSLADDHWPVTDIYQHSQLASFLGISHQNQFWVLKGFILLLKSDTGIEVHMGSWTRRSIQSLNRGQFPV